jgi:5-bromo-4-chloroindolyl phosphate hydrolysis protein
MRSSVVGKVMGDIFLLLIIVAVILFALFIITVAMKLAGGEEEYQRHKAEFMRPCVLEQQLSEKTCEERWKWMQR